MDMVELEERVLELEARLARLDAMNLETEFPSGGIFSSAGIEFPKPGPSPMDDEAYQTDGKFNPAKIPFDSPLRVAPGNRLRDVRETAPITITFTGYFLRGQTSAEFTSDLQVPGQLMSDATARIRAAKIRSVTVPEVLLEGRFELQVSSKPMVGLALVELDVDVAKPIGEVHVAARQGFGVHVTFPPARRAGSMVVVLEGETTRDVF